MGDIPSNQYSIKSYHTTCHKASQARQHPRCGLSQFGHAVRRASLSSGFTGFTGTGLGLTWPFEPVACVGQQALRSLNDIKCHSGVPRTSKFDPPFSTCSSNFFQLCHTPSFWDQRSARMDSFFAPAGRSSVGSSGFVKDSADLSPCCPSWPTATLPHRTVQ